MIEIFWEFYLSGLNIAKKKPFKSIIGSDRGPVFYKQIFSKINIQTRTSIFKIF